jgi:hypothetical protein
MPVRAKGSNQIQRARANLRRRVGNDEEDLQLYTPSHA